MNESGYITIGKEASAEFIIHKSRCIGYACPCSDEAEALEFLKKIRTKHSDATHNCYAYVIGRNQGIMRYSDDGEPGGTAGMPILDVMRKRGIVNCCVVVTRYFGGILLGAGGLVRAYSQGSRDALNAAGVIRMTLSDRYLLEVDYSTWQRLQYRLKSAPVIIENTEFETTVLCTLLMEKEKTEMLLDDFTKLTEGRIEYLYEESLFYPWPQGEETENGE